MVFALTRFSTSTIRRYYERHTRTFVTFGHGGQLGAMHRAVLAPGVTTRAAALRYVEDMIINVARPLHGGSHPLRIVDLGCGVGGSLCYIAQHLPIVGVGITVSPTQARLAQKRVAAAGVSARVSIVLGDYADLTEFGVADVAFAIESFVHAVDARRFFAQCGRLVREGGVLVICDDFRRGASDGRAAAVIKQFRDGWHINTLLEPAELRSLATSAGFAHESTIDLTPYVDIGRRRDRVLDTLLTPFAGLPWRWSRLDPWLGGSALQTCLRQGWIGYDLVIFRRRADG
jgi:SAM-dependent methyltransferase